MFEMSNTVLLMAAKFSEGVCFHIAAAEENRVSEQITNLQ